MFRIAIVTIVISLLCGGVVGSHLPHVWARQAEREFLSRERMPRCCYQGDSDKNPASAMASAIENLDYQIDTFLEFAGFVHPGIETATTSQLYIDSGRLQQYKFFRLQAERSILCNSDFKRGNYFANHALHLRAKGFYHDPTFELGFAESLCYLGKYAEAKCVIQTLKPFDPQLFGISGSHCNDNYVQSQNAYRNEILVLSLIGLQQYEEANVIMSQMDGEYSFPQTQVYLALGKNQAALKATERLENADLIKLYQPLVKLAARQWKDASAETMEIIAFHKKYCVDAIPNLEFTGAYMKQLGYEKEANQLFGEALRLKSDKHLRQ